MKQKCFFIAVIALSLLLVRCGGPSLQVQEFINLKAKDPTIHVPTPFVVCMHRGQLYPDGASQIISHIKAKMEDMSRSQLNFQFDDFKDTEEYTVYGKALAGLIRDLEKHDIEEVQVPQTLKDVANRSEHELSVFVLNWANPRTRAQNAGQVAASVAIGITAGLLTGFSPIMPFGISSRLHFVIYSKTKDAIISYEDSEDKDDPTIREHTHEEVDMLFSKFIEAGQKP